jgi:UDP-N-acetylmuramoyl-L-alanyl-D-glutamate--2,6-diaminopimelate ligase
MNQANTTWLEAWEMLLQKVRTGLIVRTHSEAVQGGEVFLALPGSRTDGAAFIADAVTRKAGYVIAPEGCEYDPTDEAAKRTMILEHPDPRRALGELAAAYHGTDRASPVLVGVTGTNGKTTVVSLTAHLLRAAGLRAGTIGTIGANWPGGECDLGMTTPDCWRLHGILARMRDAGVTHVCMEVSSHALDQQRTAGLSFEVAVLTNVTQDHLDYHQDMERYFQAKALLFASGASGPKHRVVNMDDDHGFRLFSRWGGLGYGLEHSLNRVPDRTRPDVDGEPAELFLGEILACDRSGLHLGMSWRSSTWLLRSSLVGRHNAANLLAAQGAGLRLGMEPERMPALESFPGVSGRLERIPNRQGLDIFVDYAHTPDALENVAGALRKAGFNRLIIVFGCGGNRDKTKRPLMGRAVGRHADVAVLTSDNPRHEDPEAILADVLPGLAACPQVVTEVDRRLAIQLALDMLRSGDALLVAGKGHESTQQIGNENFPFHDPTVIRRILGEADTEPASSDAEALSCA